MKKAFLPEKVEMLFHFQRGLPFPVSIDCKRRCFCFLRLRHAARKPADGERKRDIRKKRQRKAAIIPAREVSPYMAPAIPERAPAAPMKQLRKILDDNVLVQSEAVMAGMIRKAITKTDPTEWKAVTITRETRLIRP